MSVSRMCIIFRFHVHYIVFLRLLVNRAAVFGKISYFHDQITHIDEVGSSSLFAPTKKTRPLQVSFFSFSLMPQAGNDKVTSPRKGILFKSLRAHQKSKPHALQGVCEFNSSTKPDTCVPFPRDEFYSRCRYLWSFGWRWCCWCFGRRRIRYST
jgi:hypothetical protein